MVLGQRRKSKRNMLFYDPYQESTTHTHTHTHSTVHTKLAIAPECATCCNLTSLTCCHAVYKYVAYASHSQHPVFPYTP